MRNVRGHIEIFDFCVRLCRIWARFETLGSLQKLYRRRVWDYRVFSSGETPEEQEISVSRSVCFCKISCFIIVAWPSWVSETLWKTLHICVIAFTDCRNTASQNKPDILSDEEKDAESRMKNNSPAERTSRFWSRLLCADLTSYRLSHAFTLSEGRKRGNRQWKCRIECRRVQSSQQKSGNAWGREGGDRARETCWLAERRGGTREKDWLSSSRSNSTYD